MKIKTIIIDDEPIALAKLHSYVEKTPFLELVGEFSTAMNVASIVAKGDVDVIFTDINMPDIDGMQFIESLIRPPMVVFTTAYSQYAVESYKLAAVDYILKPYGFADFQRAANKVLKIFTATHEHNDSPTRRKDDSIFLKVDYRYVRVSLSNILYIKGYGEYLQIYTSEAAQPLLILSSFAAIMEMLPDNFLQIHRSYIVNMNCIDHIEKARVVIGNERLPISDTFKPSFQSYLASHSL